MSQDLFLRWWTQFLAYAGTRTNLHSDNGATAGPWVRAASGVTGVGYCYCVKRHECFIELRIDRKSPEENKGIFDRLFVHKHQIEVIAGRCLEWERLDERQHSRLGTIVPGGYADADVQWSVIHENAVDAMVRLKRAVDSHLAELKTA
jgi:hypothetical protein